MERIKIASTYEKKWLETDRPQPLIDNHIESLIEKVIKGGIFPDITDQIYIDFKNEMISWLLQSKLNQITGLNNFNRVDIINGCTQFIDCIYMKEHPQFIEGDYRYHQRLGNFPIKNLKPNKLLIIAMPFPSIGDVHPKMIDILNEALEKNISVHIDGAWFTCCRDINFNVSHPAIKSVAISLSKGLGLGWNRIGLRWTKESNSDAITLMNDFRMNNRALANIGLYFIRNLLPDYLWNKHQERYYKICKDFNLIPTKSIYIALQDGRPVGVSPLIRYLEK
jgi:hypothetical protein